MASMYERIEIAEVPEVYVEGLRESGVAVGSSGMHAVWETK